MVSPVNEGDVLAGKYKVERTLGIGGMGVVVAAKHIQLEDRVALKFLLPEALSDPELVGRFQREARAAVKIKGEHVAKVLDVGTMENGAPYMVMEFLSGNDLGALLEARGQLPLDEAVDYVIQACEAMAEAHSLGIIHRDLKPKNLFQTKRADGTPLIKVLDFGISKAVLGTEDAAVTKTTAIMGSPLYMSPEQLRASRNVDARSDLWSLGVILYELVTGKTPFLAPTMPQLCSVIMSEPPAPFEIDVPPAFQAAVFKALEKDVTKRYSNIAEFAVDIYKFGRPHNRSNVERIQRIIEAAGMSSATPDWAAATSFASTGSGTGTDTSWAESKKNLSAKTGGTSGNIPPSQLAPAQSRSGVLIFGLFGAAAIIAAAIVFAVKGSNSGSANAAATATATATPTATTAPTTEKIKIEIRSKTPGAKIYIDDGATTSNPYVVNVKPDGEFHKVKVEAAGYVTKTQSVVFEKDTVIDLDLDAEAKHEDKKTVTQPQPGTGTQTGGKGGGGLKLKETFP